jgi:uncharacterized cupin superfamily protein
MTDLGNGIHLSTPSTRAWQPDTDIGGQADLTIEDPTTTAGLWRTGQDGPRPAEPVRIAQRETIYVIAGRVRVGVDDADTFDLGTGDVISIPAGAMVGWDPSADCEVFWVYS